MSVLTLQNITKIYHTGKIQVPAIQDISMDVGDGEMLAIMGPSGSGKSTLMNIIGLLDRPTTGKLSIRGEEITLTMSDRKLAHIRSEKIGFVFQSFNLLSHMSALHNVLLPTIYSDLRGSEARKRAEYLLETVGLGDRIKHKPPELSGGEKQRVAIARALINNPDIVLADEPTGNLDTVTGQGVMEALTQLNREGKTILIITHDIEVADQCPRRVQLLDGKIVAGAESLSSENQKPWWKDRLHQIVEKL